MALVMAIVQVRSLAWELLHGMGVAKKFFLNLPLSHPSSFIKRQPADCVLTHSSSACAAGKARTHPPPPSLPHLFWKETPKTYGPSQQPYFLHGFIPLTPTGSGANSSVRIQCVHHFTGPAATYLDGKQLTLHLPHARLQPKYFINNKSI